MALAVVACVGDVPNYVEHRAACAAQDGHERDELPQPSVLNDGADVWPERHERGADAGHRRQGEDDGEPIRGPVDLGDGASWQVAGDPVPDGLGGWCTRGEVKSHGVGVGNSELSSRGLEEQENGGSLQSELVREK